MQAKVNFADNLANIAHQLKTPITAAFLSLQLMKKTVPNVYEEQIERQLERLNQLEESLLTLSKIDSGTLHLEYSQVDIYTALNLAAENLNDLLMKENISVDIMDRGCIEIYGDMEWTMEALMNLMKNCNGIGIGLSLARSIFELQNGNITARNLPEGGACFEIRVYSH